MIEAKVYQVPGVVREVALENGATVADALRAAGIQAGSGSDIKVDGRAATLDKAVKNGARIIVAKGAKGNRR